VHSVLLGGFYVDRHDQFVDYPSPVISHPTRDEEQNRGSTLTLIEGADRA